MKKITYLIFISILFSCESVKKVQEVNLYSQRHYSVDELQYENFTKLTGIKVNVTKANADELIQRLKSEGDKTEADLFITVDVGKLWQAGDMGLLQKINSEIINPNINPSLLDKNNYWVPLTYRSRILVYSNERVDKSELSSYEDLASEKWKNRILVRSSSNSYNQALVSSLVANLGIEETQKWSAAIVKNFARNPKGNDRDQVKAIAAGQGDVALVNSYYIGLLLSSQNEEELKAGKSVSVFFPNQGENQRGAHINVSGIALTKNSKNKENAIKLIKYLQTDEAQKTYVNNTYEYSVNPSISPNEIVRGWGDFKMDDLDLNLLGSKRDEAIRIFDKSGWK
ncbi:extracellular solute-binding protein [Flavobacteriales bacterium]|nr:extracellular solute-binding protein [Flavobacteriales bacterium]